MDLHRWIPLCLLVLIAVIQFRNPITSLWNWLSDVRFINILGIISLLVCFGLTICHIPGIWWTWLSFGLMISLVVLAVNLLDGKVKQGEALLIGLGIVFFVVGTWEMIYQTTNYWMVYHNEYPISAWIKEIYIELPLTVAGLVMFGYYRVIYRKKYHFNIRVLVFLGLCGLFIGVWLLMGYWIDIYFDTVKNQWLPSENSVSGLIQLQLAKGSKAFLGISMLYLMRGIK